GALVVGDVLLIEAGSVVAADARIVQADGLATDESRLTGEPMAAAKGPEPVNADAPLAERSSVLHAGTAVVAGAGEGVVVALGGLRLAHHGVLLRRLRAAEAVGAMTVLLADKTGTLTENRLLIERIDGDRERVLVAAAAAHGAAAAHAPVDRALLEAAEET